MGDFTISIGKTFTFKDFDLNNDEKITQEEYNQVLKDNKIDSIELSNGSNENIQILSENDLKKYEQKMKMKKYVKELDSTISRDFIGQNSKYITTIKSLLNDYLDNYASTYKNDISNMSNNFKKTLDAKYQELKSAILSCSSSKEEEKVWTDEELATKFEQNKSDANKLKYELSSIFQKFEYDTSNLDNNLIRFSKQEYFGSKNNTRLKEFQTLFEKISGKEQLKAEIGKLVQDLDIKDSTFIDNIFNNTYEDIINDEWIVNQCISYEDDGQGSQIDIKKVLKNFTNTFISRFQHSLEDNLLMNDINFSILSDEQEENGDNTDNNSQIKKAGYDCKEELIENTKTLIDRLKPQLVLKARTYCKLNNIEFDNNKFETLFTDIKNKCLSTDVIVTDGINYASINEQGIKETICTYFPNMLKNVFK